jgi:hypothetical protein
MDGKKPTKSSAVFPTPSEITFRFDGVASAQVVYVDLACLSKFDGSES